ncbi:MAG: PorP/SprF family type IX secretion system membrane protein [Bacteroidales bacterium]|nr:PorP/SprF family type IX secretion system membrane protein [Bacteroidales bacterium]
MKRLIFIFIIFVALLGNIKAQQIPQLSFKHQNLILNNPAAVGSSVNNNLVVLHREQWVGFEHAPSTSFISYNQSIGGRNGVGGYIISDRTFPTSRFIINAAYAYIIEMNEVSLSFGLSALVMQYKFKSSDLTYRDLLDPSLEFNADQKWRPEANAGVMLYNSKFYVALSSSQMIQSDFKPYSSGLEGLIENSRHFILSGQYDIAFNEHTISPGLYASYVKSSPFVVDASVQYNFNNSFYASAGYRLGDAVNMTLGYRYDRFFLGYSFDLIASSLRLASSSSHEVMLVVNLASQQASSPVFGGSFGGRGKPSSELKRLF